MTREEFDKYCGSLKATTHVVQWGNASVWKIGGKIFAIFPYWGEGSEHKISFKCSDLNYQVLCELNGIIPAPYLARAKWVQIQNLDAMNTGDIKDYIKAAHDIISKKLTKKMQAELKLLN